MKRIIGRKLIEQLAPIENQNSNVGFLINFKSNAEWYDSTVVSEIQDALKRNDYRYTPGGFLLSVDDIEEAIVAVKKVKPFKTFQQADRAAKILKRMMEEEDSNYSYDYHYTIVKCRVEKVSILRLEELEIENED